MWLSIVFALVLFGMVVVSNRWVPQKSTNDDKELPCLQLIKEYNGTFADMQAIIDSNNETIRKLHEEIANKTLSANPKARKYMCPFHRTY